MKKIISAVLIFILSLTFTSCNSNLIPGIQKSKYVEAAQQAVDIMQQNGKELSACGQLYLNVWHHAIFKEKDPQTDPYTRKNGKFVKDFNEALSNLYADENFQNRLAAIDTNQNELRKLRLILEDAPKATEDFNPSLLGMVNTYIEYSCVLLDGKGSYNDNLEAINQLESDFYEYTRELNAYEDEIKAFFA